MVRLFARFLSVVALLAPQLALAQGNARVRITSAINERELHVLAHNTHPLARSEYDQGAAPANLALDRMQLVLTSSASQTSTLKAFLDSQQNKQSSNYHRWLTPQQFGQQFGAAEADVKTVTAWLQSQGFQVARVSNGRNIIEFSGTAGQVKAAFHTEIHRYVVNGKAHWANSSDPEIPAALAPVVAGVATLHNFRKASQIASLRTQISRSGQPAFTGSDGTHALAPADFATIYNLNPAYAQSVNGSGATIAVVARTNILLSDIASFRSSFGLSAVAPQIVINGTDPGDLGDGDEAEAVLDTSWSGAIAPSATVKLVVSASTDTTDGVDLSEEYIVDNNLADVMTESYGDCEANYTQAEAAFYSGLASQAAAEGITYTVAAGDSGAEGCDDPSSEVVANGPVSVNVLASSPYDIAVGGTEFAEGSNTSFWSSTNGTAFASAQSYITEDAWNESCTVEACGRQDAGIWAGAGGASTLFPKPSWQAGVTGIPNDGARDLPDVAFSSAEHDFYLLCLDGSCTTDRGRSFFSGVSGTSAATPSFAGIMALVVQHTGSRQGQANYTLYSLAAQETLSACNASAATLPATGCLFNDVTVGNNAVPGETGYGTTTADYQAGTGYDLVTGLGSVNASNLIFNWTGTVVTSGVQVGIDSPSAGNATVEGTDTFSGWALAESGAISSVNVSIDSVLYGTATYGASRPDICAIYTDAVGCPNVGWSFPFNTSLLSNGTHTVDITAVSATGQIYTASSTLNVANWSASNPMKIDIDSPGQGVSVSGATNFAGWAFDSQSTVSQIAISIDGVSFGNATYGADRSDVCAVYAGEPGCPYVGWNLLVNTASLSEGTHTVAVISTTASGQSSTATHTFNVANFASNPIKLNIDTPGAQGGTYSGTVNFGGWALGTTTAVAGVSATIDGAALSSVSYGSSRSDVCAIFGARPGCPNVGWNDLVDTTQLANGLHLLTVTAATAAGESTSQTTTFTVKNTSSNNPILVDIDQPGTQSSILLGVTSFSGWSLYQGGTLSAVSVAVDGAVFGTATYGGARSDVCGVYPTGGNCPNVGWTIPVDTTKLANGSHTITVTARGAGASPSNSASLSANFMVANWTTGNPMKISIDTPNSQTAALSGVVGTGGWALDMLAPITTLTVAVDNVPLGNAFYGSSRGDVCAIFSGAPGCPNVGWNYSLDTTQMADGTHTLDITATSSTGQTTTSSSSFQVQNAGSVPIKISVDTPSLNQTLTGTTAIGGWALATNGQTITGVEILVDGEVNGPAIYGGSRSDVCAKFTTAGGCPDVGWNYELNSTVFSNGTHILEARATAANGQVFTTSSAFFVSNQP